MITPPRLGRPDAAPEPPLEPEPGVCLYAVGDIHGRADLLAALMPRIVNHAAGLPQGVRRRLVFLGDYIDRGADSRGVIDQLVQPPPEGFERVCLAGNHEEFLLGFLRDPAQAPLWLHNGGLETLESYGIGATEALALRPAHLAAAFAALLPPTHLRFLESLELLHVSGEVVFVHAGIDPARALHHQGRETLLWVREPFLSAEDACGGRLVVHGHTVTPRPQVRRHRVGIDTGAYASGRLTALALHGRDRTFLSTCDEIKAAS